MFGYAITRTREIQRLRYVDKFFGERIEAKELEIYSLKSEIDSIQKRLSRKSQLRDSKGRFADKFEKYVPGM